MSDTLHSDELEAISSIYGDECTIINQSINQSKFSICIQSCDTTLLFDLSSQYPVNQSPMISINSPMLSDAQRNVLHSECMKLWQGESCCFDMIEHFRTEAESLILANQSANQSSHIADSESNQLNDRSSNQSTNQSDIQSINQSVNQSVDSEEEEDHNDDESEIVNQKASKRTFVNQSVPSPELEPEFIIGQSITDRKSVFVPYYCPVKSESDVKLAIEYLHSHPKLSRATHIMHAYVLTGSRAFDDDGESAAGSRMLHLLEILNVSNVFVAVVRYYGGTPLGPARFKHINTATRQVLQQAQIVKPGKKSR